MFCHRFAFVRSRRRARLTSRPSAFRADTPNTLAIHREAPPFVDQSTDMEMLVTGIKVRPARTPEPAATDRRTRREPRSERRNARLEWEIFFRASARADARRRAARATDRRFVSLASLSLVVNAFSRPSNL